MSSQNAQAAMAAINDTLAALSKARTSKTPASELAGSVAKASKALSTLRRAKLDAKAALNVETAASILCSSLLNLKMYSYALKELHSHSKSLLIMYPHQETSMDTPLACLAFPLPTGDLPTPLFCMITAAQLQVLCVLLRQKNAKTDWAALGQSLVGQLAKPGNLLDWMALAPDPPSSKKVQGYLNTAFTTIIKDLEGIDSSTSKLNHSPDSLLQLRLHAFRCHIATDAYATITPEDAASKRDPVWDQFKRVVALYKRSVTTLKKDTELQDPVSMMKEVVTLAIKRHPILEGGPEYEKVLSQIQECAAALQPVDQMTEEMDRLALTSTADLPPNISMRDVAQSIDQWRRTNGKDGSLECLKYCSPLLDSIDIYDPSLDVLQTALWKALRADIKLNSTQTKHLMVALDQATAKVEAFVPSSSEKDGFKATEAASVTSLLLLASRSRGEAYRYLERARSLITLQQSDTFKSFEYVRMVSSAYFAMGQEVCKAAPKGASGEALAIRFWERSTQMASAAIAQFGSEAKELLAVLPGRRGSLAQAYQAIGETRASFNAYRAAIQAFVDTIGSAHGLLTLSHLQTAHFALYRCVVQYTRLGALDLLLPPAEISLTTAIPNAPRSVLGLLVEGQVTALEHAVDSTEGFTCTSALIEALLSHYTTTMPIRRARALVLKLSLATPHQSYTPTDAKLVLDEIDNLTSRTDYDQDTVLAPFCSVLQANAHIAYITILYQQRTIDTQALLSHLTTALALYHQLLRSVSPQQTAPAAISRKVSQLSNAAHRTPKSKTSREDSIAADLTPDATRPSTGADALSSALVPLQLAIDLIGALGFDEQRVHYMLVCRAAASAAGNIDLLVWCTAELSAAYLQANRLVDAEQVLTFGEQALDQAEKVSSATEVLFWLRCTQCHSIAGHTDKRLATACSLEMCLTAVVNSEESFDKAQEVFSQAANLSRSAHLHLLALAAHVYASMPASQQHLHSAVSHLCHAVKACKTGLQAMGLSSSAEDPFLASQPAESPAMHKRDTKGGTLRLAHLMFLSLEELCRVQSRRGSARAALLFVNSLMDASESLGSTEWVIRALLLRARVQWQAGNTSNCEQDLRAASALLRESTLPYLQSQDISALALFQPRTASEAHEFYQDLLRQLKEFIQRIQSSETAFAMDTKGDSAATKVQVPSRVLQKRATPPQIRVKSVRPVAKTAAVSKPSPQSKLKPCDVVDTTHATFQARITARLIHAALWLGTEPPLADFKRFALFAEDKAELFYLQGKAALTAFRTECSRNPLWSFLFESSLSIPPPFQGKENLSLLLRVNQIEQHYLQALKHAPGIRFDLLRKICFDLVDVRFFQTALGRVRSAAGVVAHLDMTMGSGMRSEMREKLFHREQPLSYWPGTTDDRRPSEDALRTTLRDRYATEAPAQLPPDFPETWRIYQIAISDEAAYVSHTAGKHCIVFRLPFHRHEGDEVITPDMAQQELQDLVAACRATCSGAKHVKTDEQAAWWEERRAIDTRMKELCDVLASWLGFAKILLPSQALPTLLPARFNTRLNRLLSKAMTHDKTELKLHPLIVQQLARLQGGELTDEDLEDFCHYLMSSADLGGIPIERDEVDLDQVVCDIREELAKNTRQRSQSTVEDHLMHSFLLLDQRAQMFPWESTPGFRGQSLSRLPCLDFLLDRLAQRSSWSGGALSGPDIPVSGDKTWYLINPSGDLGQTQRTMAPVLSTYPGATGLAGQSPSPLQFEQALQTKDLVLYFGHGGGEQFVSSRRLRQLDRCAVTFLWGCSSGQLQMQGEFDVHGTPWNYLVGSCPTLVANLWDVTDKDIDRFSLATFAKMGLSAGAAGETRASVPQAVGAARDACVLGYANGAAPVVYGLPARVT